MVTMVVDDELMMMIVMMMLMITMMKWVVIMMYNDVKMRYYGGIVCHKTKNALENTRRMKLIHTMMMVTVLMMTMMTIKMTTLTMEIRSCDRMDDWRPCSDQVVELQRSS